MLIEINNDIIKSLTKTEFDTYSSPATVSRAIRKCGINGFNELRYRNM